MKILIDQNISHRIIPKIAHFFDEVIHVREVGHANSNDYEIFMFTRNNHYDAIITIDDDFIKLNNTFSIPPKIIWIRTGNCSTNFLAELLVIKVPNIKSFLNNPEFSIYEVF